MPDHSRYDLDYRPRSYWVFKDHLQKALATIKGTLRRETAGRILKGEPTMSMDPYTFDESLTPAERYQRMAFGPEFASGEFLPDLQPFEVEIARVYYRSTFSDVVSVRARRVGGRILYGVLDDFSPDGQAYLTWSPFYSEKPLTMRELMQLMDTASQQPDHDPDGWFTGLVQGPVKHVYSSVAFHSDPRFTVEKERGFATVTSAFYPELSSWYEDVDSELCEEFKRKATVAAEVKNEEV